MKVVVIGAGGHAKVLIEALKMSAPAVEIICATTVDQEQVGQSVLGVPVSGSDDLIRSYAPSELFLVNGVGSVGGASVRRKIFERFHELGYSFLRVVHPSAIVSPHAQIEEGAQIMAGAIVQAGCRIGRNVIINTGAIVDHDCVVGDHVHLAPGVVLSGVVTVGEMSHLGTGARVIHCRKIGEGSIVGAGAAVVHDVEPHTTVLGVPAKEIRS